MTSDADTPGEGDEFDGWRVRWSSRRRPYFAPEHDPANPADWDRRPVEIVEPVLILTKPGRSWIEVKGQAGIDRQVMLAHGMVSAMYCDAEFAARWGDDAEIRRLAAKIDEWRQIVRVRTAAAAVQRVGGRAARMLASRPAGAGARGV
jgi:hypothetical protein